MCQQGLHAATCCYLPEKSSWRLGCVSADLYSLCLLPGVGVPQAKVALPCMHALGSWGRATANGVDLSLPQLCMLLGGCDLGLEQWLADVGYCSDHMAPTNPHILGG